MLAYVFWHRPRSGVDRVVYAAALQEFHRALRGEALDGFFDSAAYEVEGLPWLGIEPAYEDWYLVEAAFALDSLQTGAVTGRMEDLHRTVAELAGSMAAGLYGLVRGEGTDGGASWFGKPAGESYDTLYAGLVGAGGSLWRRQLVLGPTPEFCLLGGAPTVEGSIPIARRPAF